MNDAFISYSNEDEHLAKFVHDHLKTQNITAFLASVSIPHGEKWSPKVWSALNSAQWVIFLASKAACASPHVQQELGAAISRQKNLIPIVWDQPVSALPGWTGNYQAINLANRTMLDLQVEIDGIAAKIKAKKASGLALLGFIVLGIALSNGG